jgi:hypothetical protein
MPDETTRSNLRPFQPGNPGRPKGSRNKLSEAFVAAVYDDFQEHGVKAIEEMRLADPGAYVRVIASLMPKQVEIKEDAFGDLSDEQLAAIVTAARASLEIPGAGGSGVEEAGQPQPPGGVPAVH